MIFRSHLLILSMPNSKIPSRSLSIPRPSLTGCAAASTVPMVAVSLPGRRRRPSVLKLDGSSEVIFRSAVNVSHGCSRLRKKTIEGRWRSCFFVIFDEHRPT